MELPPQFLETDWPFATEIDALRRVQSLRTAVDAKLRTLALDFRAHRLHARRTELRTLQLRVHHTFTPPVAAVGEDADAPTTPGAPGRWTLHLQAVDASDASATPVSLVHYFRKVSIELDPRLYSDAMVEWTCFQRGNHDVHKLEVSRAGHTPHSVRIKLQPSHVVERYVLSDALRSALAAFVANPHAQSFTKPDVLLAVWEYIKRKNLIKEDDCRVAVCDATLRQLFQCDSLPFTSIVVALKPHLTPAPPLDVEYQLSLELPTDAEPETPLEEKIVVVDVGHVDEVERARELALQAWDELQQEQQKELALLQRQETLLLSQLDACQRKHEWLQQFAHDPAGFIADVAASQQSDMEILTSEAETDEINVPHANQFSQPWVREVVADLLIPPPAN